MKNFVKNRGGFPLLLDVTAINNQIASIPLQCQTDNAMLNLTTMEEFDLCFKVFVLMSSGGFEVVESELELSFLHFDEFIMI